MKNEEAKLNQNFIVPFVIAVQRVSSCFSSEWECCRPTKAMIYFSNCISFRCFCWCRCVCVGWLIVLAVLFSLLFPSPKPICYNSINHFPLPCGNFPSFIYLSTFFFLRVQNVLPSSRKEKSFDLPHMAWLLEKKKNVQWPVCMRKMWEIYCLTTASVSILTQGKKSQK